MRDLLERIQRMRPAKDRVDMAYDLGAAVRNYAGEIEWQIFADKKSGYAQLIKENPQLKKLAIKMTKSMKDFAEAIFDTERYVDVDFERGRPVRGRLRESLLSEALTVQGVYATLERVLGRARTLAKKVDGTIKAAQFRKVLVEASVALRDIAISIKEGEEDVGDEIVEKSQPRLNKYDPGSLLGWAVHLLEKEGLKDAAEEVRGVSRVVSRAWKEREK